MSPVLAYLEPGSGSIIAQAVLGGAAGLAVLWRSLRGRLRRGGRTEADEPVGPAGPVDPGADTP